MLASAELAKICSTSEPIPGMLSSLRSSLRYTWVHAQGSLSISILWLCVAVHILVLLLDRIGIVPMGQVFAYLGLSYAGVVRHLWIHQFVTSVLLHGGLMHLVFNMLALWMMGPDVERILGRGRYLLFTIICAVSGSVGFLLCNWGGSTPAIGYSGVIFGIMVAQAIYFPNNIISIFGIFPLKMKHAVLLLGAIELYLTIAPERGGVANAAHLFGALGALIYLKFPRQSRGSQHASGPVRVSSRAARRDPPARDWGQAGVLITAALQAIADSQYASARRCLKSAHAPWTLLLTVHHVRRLIALAQRFEKNAADSVRYGVERKMEMVWKKLGQKRLYAALPPLANVGLRHGDRIVPLLLSSLCSPKYSGMPMATRQALERALAETGSHGLEMLLAQLSDAATRPDVAVRLRILLPVMNLQKHASTLMKSYAQATPEDQARRVTCLAGMKDNCAGPMCDLLAGVLNRMPPDLRLAHAIQAKVGVRALEQIATRWAAGGHRGAQTVLTRLYGHGATSFL